MFKNLTNFSYKRSFKEVIGFYIAYLILVVVVAALTGGAIGIITNRTKDFAFGFKIGQTIAILFSVALSFFILYKKKLWNNFFYIILVLLSGLLAYVGGGLLGLIPATYLSSR